MTQKTNKWVEKLTVDLTDLASQDLGYPLDENIVLVPGDLPSGLPESLANLYQVCDGISLPDVRHGYFLERASRLMSSANRGEPTKVACLDGTMFAVCVFGSDGGGGRFALRREDDSVYYLPSSGAVRDGVYVEDTAAIAGKIADDVESFLWRLESDVAAFVRSDDDHAYIGG